MSEVWEQIYSSGSQLNRYPYDSVVSFVYRYAPRDVPRADVKILEVGSGAGNNLWFFAREGFDASGVEYSPSAVSYAERRLAGEGFSADIRQGDFCALPYGSCVFDMVVDRCSLTCVSVEDMKRAIGEVWRVLKPGGYFHFNPYSERHSSYSSTAPFRFVEPVKGSLASHGGISFLSRCDVAELLNGFEIQSIRHCEDEELIGDEFTRNSWWIAVARKHDE